MHSMAWLGFAWRGRGTFLVEDDDILLKNFSVLIHIFLALTRLRRRSIVDDEHGRTKIVNIQWMKTKTESRVNMTAKEPEIIKHQPLKFI